MDSAQLEAYEERAAIMELTRSMAERLAHISLRAEVATTAKPIPPEKMGKHYTEFHDFWRSRKTR